MIDLFLNTIAAVAGALCGLFVALLVISVGFCALAGVTYIVFYACDWIAERWR